MNDVFKWLLGRLGKEKSFLAEPRDLPHRAANLLAENNLVFSKEFYHPKKYGRRMYYFSERDRYGDWNFRQAEKLIKYPKSLSTRGGQGHYYSTMEMVERMVESERQALKDGWIPLENDDAVSNYQQVANKEGIHFDKKGDPFFINEQTARVKEVHLVKTEIKDLFNKKEELPKVETWADIYHHFINFEETDKKAIHFVHKRIKETLYTEANWTKFKLRAEKFSFLNGVPSLSDVMSKQWQSDVLNKVGGETSRISRDTKGVFAVKEARLVTEKLFFSALLVHYLRGGAALYQDMLQSDVFDKEKSEALKNLSSYVQSIATRYCGLHKTQVENIANIMTQGDWPYAQSMPFFDIVDGGDDKAVAKAKRAVKAFNKALEPKPDPTPKPDPKSVPSQKASNKNISKNAPCGPNCTCIHPDDAHNFPDISGSSPSPSI